MNEKLVAVIVLLMAVLNLVPPLFVGSGYEHKIYYSLLFLLLSFLSLVIPFLFPKLNNIIRNISMLLGGWFVSGLTYNLINFFVTPLFSESLNDNKNYYSCLFMFIIGMLFIITHDSWKKQKR